MTFSVLDVFDIALVKVDSAAIDENVASQKILNTRMVHMLFDKSKIRIRKYSAAVRFICHGVAWLR